MTWLAGPRQVGKTWIAQTTKGAYYNWDTKEVLKAYLQNPYFFRTENNLVIFDEIHKRRDWKKLLKGYYDSPSRNENFIVTGSGRLNLFRKGGDSLQGRYELFELWPLSLDEFLAPEKPKINLAQPRNFLEWTPDSKKNHDQDLITLGGFPAPLLRGEVNYLRRWMDLYIDRLIDEDVRDFSLVERIDQMKLLARLLPERVAAPISVKALSEDIDASTVGIKSWLHLFEILYFGFFVLPYHRKIHRAVKKEKKWYFYQWTYCQDPAKRFENYLAVQLALACSSWSEQGYGRWELFYLRDQDRREIDFLICCDLQPKALIEAKLNKTNWQASLSYYAKKLKIPAYLVYQGDKEQSITRVEDGWILPSSRFLHGLLIK